MSLFGSSTPAAGSTTTPLFGTSSPKPGGLFGATTTTAPTSSVPLFGTTTTSSPSTGGGLFGASKPAATTGGGGLFGSTTTAPTSTVPLFGSTTTASPSTGGGLFGSTAPKPAATTGGGLFGASTTTTTAAPAGGGLFGAAAKPGTTTTTGGGLFGTSSTTTAPTGGGLFGAKPATGGGLFGATTTTTTAGAPVSFGAPPVTSVGLGGIQQQTSSGITNTTGNVTSSLTGTGEKDAAKEGEWTQVATMIRDLLPLIEDKLKKNRDFMDETESMSIDNVAIEEQIDKTRGMIGEVRRDVATATVSSEGVAQLVSHDKSLVETARKVQEQAGTANQTLHAELIKQHLGERIQVYDLEMRALQDRVNFMRNRFEKLLKGETSLTMEELDAYFQRCDNTVSNASFHVETLGKEIEEVRDLLIEQGYTQLRKWNNGGGLGGGIQMNPINEGAEFFPSQSSLAIIGSSLRAPAQPQQTTGTLGLGTGSSLFGNTGGTTSLFGSTTAKPTFSGGSLFGNTSNPTSSTSTTTPTTSLFGSKPTTTTSTSSTTTINPTPFASTVANNSSGLLFSSKK